MRSVLGSLVIAAAVTVAPVALADGTPPPSSADPSTPTHWYGYQTLATDGAALTLAIPAIFLGGSGAQTPLGIGGALTYGLGAPIVHFAHGRFGQGVFDLGLRAGMPVILGFFGAMVGTSLYDPPACRTSVDSGCGLGDGIGHGVALAEGAALGGMMGIGGAVAIDAAVLAREGGPAPKEKKGPDDEPRVEIVTARWQPAFGVTPERQGGARATVGVIGSF